MKKSSLLIILLITFTGLMAQQMPMGINYQGVARDLSGDVLAGQDISIKITLVSDIANHHVDYSETHLVTTSKLGLFTLVVGEGNTEQGKFEAVSWSSNEIWFELSIDVKGGSNYDRVSTSRLLAVPYAFHAGTAESLSGYGANEAHSDGHAGGARQAIQGTFGIQMGIRNRSYCGFSRHHGLRGSCDHHG